MVKLAGFAAINQERQQAETGQPSTLEAQEAGVIEAYEDALRAVQRNQDENAEAHFRSVISDPLVEEGTTEQLQRIKFLALKNLASLVGGRAGRAAEALDLYAAATEADGGDVSLWDCFGSLAAQAGEWALARHAFERGLMCDPRHPTLKDKLLQLLLHIGDCAGAIAFAKALLRQNPRHALAGRVAEHGLVAAPPTRVMLQLPAVSSMGASSWKRAAGPEPHAVEVQLERCSWACVMEQCARLLMDPSTACAAVKFVASQPPGAVEHTADRAQAADMLQPLAGAERAAEPARAESCDSALLPETAAAPNAGAPSLAIGPMGVADAAPPQAVDKGGAHALAPDGQQQSRSDAKRSARQQKSLQATMPGAHAEEGGDGDPYGLLRTLGQLLCTGADAASRGEQGPASYAPEQPHTAPPAVASPEAAEVSEFAAAGSAEVFLVSEGLVARWAQPAAATVLAQAGAVGGLLELVASLHFRQWRADGLPASSCLLLGELFADAAAVAVRGAITKQRGLAAEPAGRAGGRAKGARQAPAVALNPTDLRNFGTLWLARYRAGILENGGIDGGSTGAERLARYWWARGRLHEAAVEASQATLCYTHCGTVLAQGGLAAVALPYCRLDAALTPAAVAGKLEVLQLHGVLKEARELAAGGHPAAAVQVLAPVLLPCSTKEQLMAEMDRRTWLQALQTLLGAAGESGDVALALRCHLRTLHALLPPASAPLAALLEDPSAPDPVAAAQPALSQSGAAALAPAADFLAEHAAELAAMAGDALHTHEWQALRDVLRQLACVLHAAGADLRATCDSRSHLNSRANALRQSMCDAATALLQLWALDSAAQHSVDASLDLSYALCEALGDAGALLERRGAFVQALMPRLRSALAQAEGERAPGAGGLGGPAAADAEALVSLRSGLHHCIYWLHGVQLPGLEDESWGGGLPTEGFAGARPLASREAALEVWPLISDFLEAQSATTLRTKYSAFLDDMAALFPAPPPPLGALCAAAWARMGEVEPPTVGDAHALNPLEALLEEAQAVRSAQGEWQAGAGGVAVDGGNRAHPSEGAAGAVDELEVYRPVYRLLFHLRAVMQPPVEDGVEASRGMLEAGADAATDALLEPYRWDLCFNPCRYEDGWRYLAMAYNRAAALLLEQAASEVPHSEWRRNAWQHARVARYRRLGLWCAALGARYVPLEDDRADMLDEAAAALFSDIQDVPPFFDQLRTAPHPGSDPLLRAPCARALAYYEAAAALLGDEYYYQLQSARCMRNLCRPPEDWLPRMALACHYAAVYHKGLLDPLHALHAARLELVCDLAGQRTDPGAAEEASVEHTALLRLLARYCFTREAQAELSAVLHSEGGGVVRGESAVRAVGALLRDGMAAMSWCLEKDKYYYKAAIALANASRHRPEQAIEHLAPLFSKPKTLFCINMYALHERSAGGAGSTKSGRRHVSKKAGPAPPAPAPAGVAGAASGGEVGVEGGAAEGAAPESDYGLAPAGKTVGIGEGDSVTQFIGNMRAAVALYLDLLSAVESTEILQAAAQYFQQSPAYQAPGFSDVRALAQGQYVLTLFSAANRVCPLVEVGAGDVVEMEWAGAGAGPGGQGEGPAAPAPRERRRVHLQSLAASVDTHAAAPVLQRLYHLWVQNTVLRDSGAEWETAVAAPARWALPLRTIQRSPEAATVAAVAGGRASRLVATLYAELCVLVLARTGAADTLRSLLQPLKRRLGKALKLVTKEGRHLVERLYSAAGEALLVEAAPLRAEAEQMIPELRAPPRQPSPPPPPPVVAAPAAPALPAAVQQPGLVWAVMQQNFATSVQNYVVQGLALTPEVQLLLQQCAYTNALQTVLGAAPAGASQAVPAQHPYQHPFQQAGGGVAQQAAVRQPPRAPPTAEQSAETDIGPPASMQTEAEAALQERVMQQLKATHAFVRDAWVGGGASAALLATRSQVEDLQLVLHRIYSALAHVQVAPMTRAEVLKACDELVRAHKRQSKAAAATAAAAGDSERPALPVLPEDRQLGEGADGNVGPAEGGRSACKVREKRARDAGQAGGSDAVAAETSLPEPAAAGGGSCVAVGGSPRKRPRQTQSAAEGGGTAEGAAAGAQAGAAPVDTEVAEVAEELVRAVEAQHEAAGA